MKKILLTGTLLVVSALLSGCAKERVFGNLYEGIQMQKRQETQPNGYCPKPPTGYDEYLRQRREVIQEPPPIN